MRYVAGAGVVNCDILYSGITRLPSEGEKSFLPALTYSLAVVFPALWSTLQGWACQSNFPPTWEMISFRNL